MSAAKPLGRMTIRKGLVSEGKSRIIGLWNIEAKPGSTVERLQGAYLAGLDAVDQFDAKRESLAKDTRYTDQGRKEQLLDFAAKDLAKHLRRGRDIVERAKQDLAQRRANLKPPTADKTDVAGAILRQEIRQQLKSMGASDLSMLLAQQGANLDPNVALAIIETPMELTATLTGVTASQREVILDRHLRSTYGEAVDDIDEIERAIEKASQAVEAGRDLISFEAAGGDRKKFDELAAPAERSVSAPWLRRSGEEVHVVDLENGRQRKATQDEQENGVFYRDYAEYARANGLPEELAA